MRVATLFVFLATLVTFAFAASKKERFSHAEFTYPPGQYSSLNAVSRQLIYPFCVGFEKILGDRRAKLQQEN